MSERLRQLEEVLTEYKQARTPLPKPNRLAAFLRKEALKKQALQRHRKEHELASEIQEILWNTSGNYPVAELRYGGTGFAGQTAFVFGFDYDLGDETFQARNHSYNRWGLPVQSTTDNEPFIEVLDKDDPRRKDSGSIRCLVRLPQGYQIPVGPINFKEDSVPKTQEDYEEEERAKQIVLKFAESAGIKLHKRGMEAFERMNELTGSYRKPVNRYFYWQPEIPDEPRLIGISFDEIEPYHMGLSLETAPTFTNAHFVNRF